LLKIHQNSSAGRALPGPAAELTHSPDLLAALEPPGEGTWREGTEDKGGRETERNRGGRVKGGEGKGKGSTEIDPNGNSYFTPCAAVSRDQLAGVTDKHIFRPAVAINTVDGISYAICAINVHACFE